MKNIDESKKSELLEQLGNLRRACNALDGKVNLKASDTYDPNLETSVREGKMESFQEIFTSIDTYIKSLPKRLKPEKAFSITLDLDSINDIIDNIKKIITPEVNSKQITSEMTSTNLPPILDTKAKVTIADHIIELFWKTIGGIKANFPSKDDKGRK